MGKNDFLEENGPFFGFKSAKMVQNWVDLHDINVALFCRMFKGVFDRPGASSDTGGLFSH